MIDHEQLVQKIVEFTFDELSDPRFADLCQILLEVGVVEKKRVTPEEEKREVVRQMGLKAGDEVYALSPEASKILEKKPGLVDLADELALKKDPS